MKVRMKVAMGSFSNGAIVDLPDERAAIWIGQKLCEPYEERKADKIEPPLGPNGFTAPPKSKMVKRTAAITK